MEIGAGTNIREEEEEEEAAAGRSSRAATTTSSPRLVPEHGRPPTRDMYSLLIFPSLRHGPGITARHHMHSILIPMIIEADITIPAPRQDPSLLKIVFLLCPPRIIPKTSNQTRMEASLRI